MASRRDAPHTRPRLLLLLCLSVSFFLSPWASCSSVSRKLQDEEELQFLQYIEHPQTRNSKIINSMNDPLLEKVDYNFPSLEDDGSLLNVTILRPHSSQSNSVVRRPRNHHLSHDVPLITSSGGSSGRGSGRKGDERPVVRTHRHTPVGNRRRQARGHTRRHPPPDHYHERQEPPSRRYRAQYRSVVNHAPREQHLLELASSLSDSQDFRNNTASEIRRVQHPHRANPHRVRNPHYHFAPFPLSPPLQQISHQPVGRPFHGQTHEDPNYHPIVQHIYPQVEQRVEYLQPLSTPRPPPHYSPVIPRLQSNSRSDPPIPPQHQHHHQHQPVQQPQQVQQHYQHEQHEQQHQHPQLQHEQTVQGAHKAEEVDDDEGTSILRGADDLRVGKALNIFSRYGFLTLSVKVRPPVGDDNFLFLENTAEVFQRNSYWGKRETRRHRGNYDDHFYIHFCENLNELLIAYFDHFTIEGVPKAHKAFTSSLSVRDLARQFGISYSFLNGHFSFVLVRLFRRRRRSTLQGPLEMHGSLRQALEDVRVGSTESVHQFVDRFGSHVITEFEVGDIMYQTFVFGDRLYKELKNQFAVVTTSENHLEELQLFFTPNFATSVGSVLLASGNDELNRILKSKAASPELLHYPNIFKMFENPTLEAELEKLDGEVVLSLKLDKITSRLPRTPETGWVSEVLDTTLAIYYQHMASTRKNT